MFLFFLLPLLHFCIYYGYMSRRKSTPHHTPLLSYELTNIIAGGVLVTLAVLMVLSTRELTDPSMAQPFVGKYLSQG